MKKLLAYCMLMRKATNPMRAVACLLCLTALCGCVDRGDLRQSLARRQVLAHYRFVDRDTLKYQAAEFLLDNMKYHTSKEEMATVPAELEEFRTRADSSYHALVKDASMDDMPWDAIDSLKERWNMYVREHPLPEAAVTRVPQADADVIDADFLIGHIDNAFEMWRTSEYARNLSFEDFKEYLLPYRSVRGYGFLQSGEEYRELFGKYLDTRASKDLPDFVDMYNTHINNLRNLGGHTTRQATAGVYDMYTRDFHGCVDVASYGCNILRACGLPVVVEHNICYRSLSGRHYHCSAYNASTGTWQTFNPESSLPGEGDWAFAETANVYRSTFAAQKDTPPFLKAEGEYVPSVLNDPCMKDVTAYLARTASITLPFPDTTACRLAYLATYSRDWQGVIPVTWGVINKPDGTVTFEHAMPDILYFPIYYPDEDFRAFGKPFYIEMADGAPVIREIPYIDDADTARTPVTLTRKYPRKPGMKRVAEELVGGRILGSRKGDFSDAVTLLEIKEAPQPALLTHPLAHTGHYKSYRFQASEEHPSANISMLEWLAPESYGYANTMPAMRQHILCPKDTALVAAQSHLVRVMDADKWEDRERNSEYDGNMQTAPSPYRDITLWLKEPQKLTHVRFSPLNADNGICAGDEYELRYWADGWHICGSAIAKYEYIEFPDVPRGRLYWLVNLTQGKEEMPFVLDEQGRQRFVYYEIMDIDKYIF